MLITVELRNPPVNANKWQVIVIDQDVTKALDWGFDAHGNILEVATFDIPAGWRFPLLISISIYEEWQENEEWHARQLYWVQSYKPYEWDWEKGEWSDIPDPTYREIFLPDYGNYYYDVTTEELVLTELAPVAPDWITPLIIMGLLIGIIIPTMKGVFK